MQIKRIRVELARRPTTGGNDLIRAFVTLIVTGPMGDFMVRNLKVVAGHDGREFVAMPSRKIETRCPGCDGKNEVMARYCNWCGREIKWSPSERVRTHVDVFHPLDEFARENMDRYVLSEYMRAVAQQEVDHAGSDTEARRGDSDR